MEVINRVALNKPKTPNNDKTEKLNLGSNDTLSEGRGRVFNDKKKMKFGYPWIFLIQFVMRVERIKKSFSSFAIRAKKIHQKVPKPIT